MALRPRFRLLTMLAIIGCIALAINYFQYQHMVPVKQSTIYYGRCYTIDWKRFLDSSSAPMKSDGSAYVVDVEQPADLFKDFAAKPTLWSVTLSPGTFWNCSMQFRPHDRPVDGPLNVDVNDPRDVRTIGRHEFLETVIPPRRLHIDFDIQIETQYVMRPHDDPSNVSQTHRLKFDGIPGGKLIVFAGPLDDELMWLILIDPDD